MGLAAYSKDYINFHSLLDPWTQTQYFLFPLSLFSVLIYFPMTYTLFFIILLFEVNDAHLKRAFRILLLISYFLQFTGYFLCKYIIMCFFGSKVRDLLLEL